MVARGCACRGAGQRKKVGGGISGSLLRVTRESCRGRFAVTRWWKERHGEVVRCSPALREAASGRAARSLSRVLEERTERAIPVFVVEIIASPSSYARVDACVRACVPACDRPSGVRGKKTCPSRELRNRRLRALQDGLKRAFASVILISPAISDVIRSRLFLIVETCTVKIPRRPVRPS